MLTVIDQKFSLISLFWFSAWCDKFVDWKKTLHIEIWSSNIQQHFIMVWTKQKIYCAAVYTRRCNIMTLLVRDADPLPAACLVNMEWLLLDKHVFFWFCFNKFYIRVWFSLIFCVRLPLLIYRVDICRRWL